MITAPEKSTILFKTLASPIFDHPVRFRGRLQRRGIRSRRKAVVASLVRFAAIFDDFWLDEIWSWRFARSARSAREIILDPAFHHDNKHWLNTLYWYALGDRENWYVYRLLSIATSIGLLLLLWNIARQWGRVATISTLIFAGFAYIGVQYSSEAR